MSGCVLPKTVYLCPTVKGHVYDARTKKPVAGAVVTFKDVKYPISIHFEKRPIVIKTNAKGEFTLFARKQCELVFIIESYHPPFLSTLLISREGYRDYTESILFQQPSAGIKAMLQPATP